MNLCELSVLLLSYIVGSIPFGLVFVKLFGKGDLRAMGSGNIGATNVMRTQGNRVLGILTFLCDFLKGYLTVFFTINYFGIHNYTCVLVGFIVVVGHVFSIFTRLHGGKGVATSFGVFLALTPLIGLLSVLVWVMTFALFRISAVSGLFGVFFAPLLTFVFLCDINYLQPLYFMIAALVCLRHVDNIKRIIDKKELSFKCNERK